MSFSTSNIAMNENNPNILHKNSLLYSVENYLHKFCESALTVLPAFLSLHQKRRKVSSINAG